MTEGYNGYNNYETWLAALHDVHEGHDEYIESLIKERQEDGRINWVDFVVLPTKERLALCYREGIVAEVEDQLFSSVDALVEMLYEDRNIFLTDMLNSALQSINYRELAEKAVEGYLEDNKDN